MGYFHITLYFTSPREVGAKGFTFIDSEIAGSEQGGDSPKTHSL